MSQKKTQLTVISKAAYVKDLIARDGGVLLHVRPDVPGVVLPTHLQNRTMVVLSFGVRGTRPIANLNVAVDHISADLTFSPSVVMSAEDVVINCRFPWPAVFAIVERTGKGLMWEEDAPPAVEQEYTLVSQATSPTGKTEFPIIISLEPTIPEA